MEAGGADFLAFLEYAPVLQNAVHALGSYENCFSQAAEYNRRYTVWVCPTVRG